MDKQQDVFWFTPKGIAAIGLIGAVSYFLFIEHRQHLFEFLPYLILLLCPLMHVFMHGKHGGHHHNDNPDDISLEDAYRQGVKDGVKHSKQSNPDIEENDDAR